MTVLTKTGIAFKGFAQEEFQCLWGKSDGILRRLVYVLISVLSCLFGVDLTNAGNLGVRVTTFAGPVRSKSIREATEC